MTSLGDVLLEEYRTVKAEQNDRIKTRDNLVYATMAAMAAVTYAALTLHLPDLMLALPAAVLTLGWLYLGGDRKIAWARDYLRTSLRPRLAEHLHLTPDDLLGWETPHRHWGLSLWRVGGLLHDLALFVAAPAGVLGWWAIYRWDSGSPFAVVWLALAADTVLVTVAAFASTAARQPIYGRAALAKQRPA